jgi:hypothetical protein
MHFKQADYRSTALTIFCTSSTNAIDELIKFSKAGLLDGITAMEYAEYFYGAVLVACQAYATGTVSDINESQNTNYKKLVLYKYMETKYHEYSYIELINVLANYFKHNEEWDKWPVNETTKTLRYFGINENTEFPLRFGIKELVGESEDLRDLCSILENWRWSLLNIRNKIF